MRHLLRLAREWALRSFGLEQMSNPPLRSLRVVEEAIELCQACGVPKEKVLLCIEKVYERPVGTVAQEIGGVLMTIYLFVDTLNRVGMQGIQYQHPNTRLPEDYFADELARVLGKPPKHFTDRNAEKVSMGLDA